MVTRTLRRTGIVVGLSAALGFAAGAPALAASGWEPTGSMAVRNRAHAVALLPDGDPLAISGFDGGFDVPSAERYDTATGTWTMAAPVLVPRHYASATRLTDGRILVTGGDTATGITTSSEVYDSVANTWTATGALNTPRNGHSAVLLGDGRVLVIGGSDDARLASATGEVYDPATGFWTTTANRMSDGRENLNAALLADGRVLTTGGFNASPSTTFHASADVYDPATNSWSPAASMATARGQAATASLPDGRMLVAGGVNRDGFVSGIELYDPAAGSWSSGGRLPYGGNIAYAATLDDGRVLVTNDASRTTPLIDPASGAISSAYAMRDLRALPSLTTLRDGRVLAAGGSSLSSAELFTPPTERSSTVPEIGSVRVGETVERDVTVANAGGNRMWIDGSAIAGADAGDFAIVTDGCAGRELAPAASCVVRVRFTPSAVGARAAQLTFDDNAESSPAAPLAGVGATRAVDPPVDPPVGPPVVPVVPAPPAAPQTPAPPVAPGAPARPAKPPVKRRAIERFRLTPNCVRPTASGVVRVDFRLRLATLRPVELRIARGVGTKGMARCPAPDPNRRFTGRLRGVQKVSRLAPTAVVATVSGRRTIRLRLTPGLYRLTIRARTEHGFSRPAHRWLRVIAPR
ncbi:kelch repeat-containing protein [Conexibacter stalactiti]|uniref:Kelch repeat-containing protein n=1 Tax=Conexibacter stalactiti TaxID=1940611 RepID=A0ABU4HQ37_9ACTN|nr:kelch repeat-containing protein [Conexibacter stalactiti]MDW5595427.1 kelch repeat-containing protein [Conexibacter stalactiti]MEC5036069.1 kelch repeat-containing protein [Conexibacter stalactiti]